MGNKNIIKEELSKSDVDNQLNKFLSTQKFKNAIENIVKARLKSEPELESKIVEINKNVLTQLFKTLWVKRGVWRDNLSNKSS